MTKIRDIYDFLNALAPVSLKMDFDNVGLLVGDYDAEAEKCLLALDITDEVIQEAKSIGAELIVSHHPLIFGAIKSVTVDDLTGRIAKLEKVVCNARNYLQDDFCGRQQELWRGCNQFLHQRCNDRRRLRDKNGKSSDKTLCQRANKFDCSLNKQTNVFN